jgi:hypothetical protein
VVGHHSPYEIETELHQYRSQICCSAPNLPPLNAKLTQARELGVTSLTVSLLLHVFIGSDRLPMLRAIGARPTVQLGFGTNDLIEKSMCSQGSISTLPLGRARLLSSHPSWPPTKGDRLSASVPPSCCLGHLNNKQFALMKVVTDLASFEGSLTRGCSPVPILQ